MPHTTKENVLQDVYELIATLQIHLAQEFGTQSWFDVSRESYLYYKNFAMGSNQTIRKAELKAPVKERNDPIIKNQEIKIAAAPLQSNVKAENEKAPLAEVLPPTLSKDKNKNSTAQPIREQISLVDKQDFSDIKQAFLERFSDHVILPQPPDDSLAKSVKNAWKTNVKIYLVVPKIENRHHSFLANVNKAIKIVYGVNGEIIEKNSMPPMMKGQSIELKNLDAYLLDSKLKANLWKVITETLGRNNKE